MSDLSILDDTVQRWRGFAAKIRARADELHAQGWEETCRLQAQAGSANDNAAYIFWSGVAGQIGSLRDKLSETFEKNVVAVFEAKVGVWRPSWGRYDIEGPAEALLRTLRGECNALDEHLLEISTTRPSDAHAAEDAEQAYQRILQDHERGSERFACRNCGAQLSVRLSSQALYVDCPYCQTKNTFQPSDAACMLPAVAEDLAEGRVRAQRERWAAAAQAVPLWSQEAAAQWRAGRAREVECYVDYIHAKFDVIDSVVPELKAHNDRVRESRIQDKRKTLPD